MESWIERGLMIPVYFLNIHALEFMDNYDKALELYQRTKVTALKALGNGTLILAFRSKEKRNVAYVEWKKFFPSTALGGTGEAEEEWLGPEGELKREKK